MGKNKKNKKNTFGFIPARGGDAWKKMAMMKHQDLQRNCIIRGMPPEDLVDTSHYDLQAWLAKYWDNDLDTNLLDKFDNWREAYMKKRNINEPFVRLGFIGETNEEGEIVTRKKIKGIKKSKKKRDRNSDLNLYSGTKKELTYISQKQGKTLDETIELVMEKFPEAKEKSISIWFKRSKRGA